MVVLTVKIYANRQIVSGVLDSVSSALAVVMETKAYSKFVQPSYVLSIRFGYISIQHQRKWKLIFKSKCHSIW